MDDYFTICQHKTEKPRNIEISAPISLEFVLVWNKHVFPRSKMTVFQTYNKQYVIKNVVVLVEIFQLHRYTITVITWLYLEKEKENFQSMAKHRTQVCMLIFFYSGHFTCFSAWMRWCVNGVKTQALSPVKNQNTFFASCT